MGQFRLICIHGQLQTDAWALDPNRRLLIGRSDADSNPDIDLSDTKVSRQHAWLWFQDGEWWIEDQNSRNGTCVAGQEIKGQGPVPLTPWTEVQIKETVLMLCPPNWHRLKIQDVVVDLEMAPSINLSLVHCEEPVISQIVVRNEGARFFKTRTLEISVPGCKTPPKITLPKLRSGATTEISPPHFQIDYATLDAWAEEIPQSVTVKINEEGAKELVPCRLLAPNAWSCEQQFRHQLSTAAFVLRDHPHVREFTREAMLRGEDAADPVEALKAIYTCLSDVWDIHYRAAPPSEDVQTQKIRLPHQVLGDLERKTGEGTCVDLALLVAACLESLELQALVAILEMNVPGSESPWRHAIVGCWKEAYNRDEAVLRDKNRVRRGVVWIDPNGCTRDSEYRKSFLEACAAAERQLNDNRFLFALDVSAARTVERIQPLPFTGNPQWGEVASTVLEKAEESARSIGSVLGAPNLLVGFLRTKGKTIQQVFEQAGLDPKKADKKIEAGLPAVSSQQLAQPTQNYEGILDRAQKYAQGTASAVISETHLLEALLKTQRSPALNKALAELGTDRRHLLAILKGESSPALDSDSELSSNFQSDL